MIEQPTTAQPADKQWTPSRIARAGVILIALVCLAMLLISLTNLFLLIFAAIVLSAVFETLASLMQRWTKLPRGLALTAAVLLILGSFIGIFAMFGAQLAAEFDTIREKFPTALEGIQQQLDSWGVGGQARELVAGGTKDLTSVLQGAGGYALSAGSGLADFALVLVGAIFLAVEPGVYRRGLVLLMPERAEDVTEAALDDAGTALKGWMIGQLMSMVVVAAFTALGLWLLGVPAAGGLGLIAGLLDIIPFIGPIIAAVPAVLLAFTVSPSTALWTVGLFLLIQQIQGNLLQPLIQKRAVDVPPGVLLFAVAGAGILFGLLGVLLAAPLTVVIFVLVQRIYVKTLLGKPIETAAEKAD
ncbi:AI-2E family transporter [Sphingomonas sp. S1-29]|uniref:AI-2E family transporter n=1 Tax=Sphingomonas sp. S1-29 TaxID=2991074 RepID=UPI00223FE22B|nr:AI-2E family transporter [Sphingomonas sp. S1-29]UZK69321.1 AI-2E family transporter [Sphingomonas sp. S1-29]